MFTRKTGRDESLIACLGSHFRFRSNDHSFYWGVELDVSQAYSHDYRTVFNPAANWSAQGSLSRASGTSPTTHATPILIPLIWRIALATAILWIGFNAGGRAEAGGIALTTPAGLSPGDSFRFVFITDGSSSVSSSNITSYNNFVNAQAGDATYDGSVVSWFAIGSTSAVSAINNIGQTLTPVYLADGTLVTSSTTTTGLWSGSLENPIDEDLSGSLEKFLGVFTGTTASGFASGDPLGNFLGVTLGNSGHTNAAWVDLAAYPSFLQERMYGISQVLVATAAVPEPSAVVMAGTAIIAGFLCSWSRGRRGARHHSRVSDPAAKQGAVKCEED